jgi:uncharacterized membrane protein
MQAERQAEQTTYRGVTRAGIFLGLGLGGFFDGIVLHQILQWHHMVTERYPVTSIENLQLNTLGDGLFHALTYIFTTTGIFLLWRSLQTRQGQSQPLPMRILLGAMLMGWGLFNLVEGLINHHLLQIHHVRSGPNTLAWDVAFLAWGASMLMIGWLVNRSVSTHA